MLAARMGIGKEGEINAYGTVSDKSILTNILLVQLDGEIAILYWPKMSG